ncbi:MAG: four helix bundle protein [Deltaproteobacteria bacterium]|nr:four helix bundle protein [Deltaproteobacteria bacterium]
MKNFRDLKVWQKAHQLALCIYTTTKHFPKEELYGLTSQIRRSSMSVPTNIAEGCGRGSDADLNRFLYISMGSACELEYQILLSCDLKFITKVVYDDLYSQVIDIKKMLTSLTKKISTG